MSLEPLDKPSADDGGDELALKALRAGLGYGPATDPKQLIDAILEEQRHRTTVSLQIPTILHDYFVAEAANLGMTESELMVRILETHRFAYQRYQHLTSAISQKQNTLQHRESISTLEQ